MEPIPLNIPPGMYKNGTDYQALGKWVDGNMIRWRNNAAQAIGGWSRRQQLSSGLIPQLVTNPATEVIRDAIAWQDNAGNANIVVGSNVSLTHISQGGVVTDVTPATAAVGMKDAQTQSGYGQNLYGVGAYGAANNLSAAAAIPPLRWALTTWGQDLLTLQRGTGPVYSYTPGGAITTLSNAPTGCQDLTVTDDRIVFSIGAGGEARLAKWSDQEDNNDWTPTEANQAGDQVVTGQGNLIRCVNFLERVMILSTTDLQAAQYIGPPYVYRIDKVGENCGPLAAESVAVTSDRMVWVGYKNFWMYDGTLSVLPSSVQDFFYADIDTNQISKLSAVVNSDFSEVWWLYQSRLSTTDEVDSYVVWNYVDNVWYTGKMARTAGIDKGATLFPVLVSDDGFIYNHEQADLLPTSAVYLESGPLELGAGGKNMAVRYIFHDAFIDPIAGGSISLIGQEFPRATQYVYGPYSPVNPISTRAMGRTIKVRFDNLTFGDKVGNMRIDVAPITGSR